MQLGASRQSPAHCTLGALVADGSHGCSMRSETMTHANIQWTDVTLEDSHEFHDLTTTAPTSQDCQDPCSPGFLAAPWRPGAAQDVQDHCPHWRRISEPLPPPKGQDFRGPPPLIVQDHCPKCLLSRTLCTRSRTTAPHPLARMFRTTARTGLYYQDHCPHVARTLKPTLNARRLWGQQVTSGAPRLAVHARGRRFCQASGKQR